MSPFQEYQRAASSAWEICPQLLALPVPPALALAFLQAWLLTKRSAPWVVAVTITQGWDLESAQLSKAGI